VKVFKNELVVVVDCDGTLIKPSDHFGSGTFSLPYGSSMVQFEQIKVHVDLLKEYKNRGFVVVVWSMGGWAHAQRIVEALKIERFVDIVMSKPNKYVDDRTDIESILGTRIFLA
jgi:HAD superfamily phosphatase (TIGR01681 family)